MDRPLSSIAMYVDGNKSTEVHVQLPADSPERGVVKVGYATQFFPRLEYGLDNSLSATRGWGATDMAKKLIVGRPVLLGQLAELRYWRGVVASETAVLRNYQESGPPQVPTELGLESFSRVLLYNPQCVKQPDPTEEPPFTLLLVGNVRSFPLMVHPIDQLACQYAHRRWLVLASVAERVQHSDLAWWMKQKIPETMIAPTLQQLQELNTTHPQLQLSFCHAFEAVVINKARIAEALPPRLLRDIDIHRDHRGHCAYNEKLARLKIEYLKVAIRRAEELRLEQTGAPMKDSDLVIVTRPDVDLNSQGKEMVQGLDQMAAKLQEYPRTVFLHRNVAWGLHDQWFITSRLVLHQLTSLDLSCAFHGIREFDRYCINAEGYLLYMFHLVCAQMYYIDPVLSKFSMMRAMELSYAEEPRQCKSGADRSRQMSTWPEFDLLDAWPREKYPGAKGGGMFMNETFTSRYCHEPPFCSRDAIAAGLSPALKQADDLILP